MTPADVVLPDGYSQMLDTLKGRVREARLQALRTVNTELIELYWHIGHEIRTQQDRQGWGSKVVRQLAEDLRAEFPDMTGLSRSNLQYMRAFAGAWTNAPVVCRGGRGVWVVAQRVAEHDHEQLDAAHQCSVAELHPAALLP
jgi:hypothetical protein